MPQAVIIRGYCGTGKSSVAKLLARKRGMAFLEYDNFLWNMNLTKKPKAAEYELTYKNLLSVLRNYLAAGKDILIEGPLVPRTEKDPFDLKKVVALLKKAKYACAVVQLRADERTCVQRMKQRGHIVPRGEREMFKRKHDDSVLEAEIIIDTSKLTPTQVVHRIIGSL